MTLSGLPAAWWGLIKQVASSWLDDYVPSMGAALAYYTMFSLAPLLLIVVSVSGLAFGDDAARGDRVAVERALHDCQNAGLDAWVYEGLRSPELQAAYYARGRTEIPPHKPVTNAKSNIVIFISIRKHLPLYMNKVPTTPCHFLIRTDC